MSRIITLTAALVALAVALPAAASAAPPLLVNLGDSYATGYQRNGPGNAGRSTRQGYADQLVPRLRAKGYRDLKLVNFGCGGATTVSLNTRGCAPAARAVDGAPYGGRSQLAAAERFIRRNREDVELITVSIGGNDVTRCAREAEPVPCVATAVETIKRNLAVTVRRLRAAAGRDARIVGLTYPNVILGEYVGPNRQLAELSVVAFQQLINPALKATYATVGGRFVDVTRGFAGYTPFSVTTPLAPYGSIPVAVERICTLSYYCALKDIHLRTTGYREMARLIAATIPRRRG